MDAVARERPGSDIDFVQKMLSNRGIKTPGIYVGVNWKYFSKDRRSEMLIIYGEQTTVRGIDCRNEETAAPLVKKLYKEALKEFSIRQKPH